jgi:hypothetical protein
MPLTRKKSTTLKIAVASSIILSLLALFLFVSSRSTLSAGETELGFYSYAQTSDALQKQVDPSPRLKLSLRTDKPCYLNTEPVHAWVELANIVAQPVTVMKTMRFIVYGLDYGARPLVDGQDASPLITAFGGNLGPLAEEFVVLFPNESVSTYIPDFWSLISPSRNQQPIKTGPYQLAIRYNNGNPGPISKVEKQWPLKVILKDIKAWTGVLTSNAVSIQMVDKLSQCTGTF